MVWEVPVAIIQDKLCYYADSANVIHIASCCESPAHKFFGCHTGLQDVGCMNVCVCVYVCVSLMTFQRYHRLQ